MKSRTLHSQPFLWRLVTTALLKAVVLRLRCGPLYVTMKLLQPGFRWTKEFNADLVQIYLNLFILITLHLLFNSIKNK